MKILYWLIVLAGGYLLGSLNFSIILSRLLGRDIRKQGSGNAGATNMTRVFGWAAGVATLAFDVLKAFAAMWIGRRLLGDMGVCLGGIAVMSGHCFPLFHNFKGGKGIATGAAVGFMIDWRVGAAIVAVFLIGALISRKVSVGSISAAVAIVIATWIFAPKAPMIALAVYSAVLAISRHDANIKRLQSGTEPDFRAADPEKKQ
ncbi:MAG: glycerol-3-phosphate 1-O-acyltransferase PlsY [Oscillospiraceae bacterium]|nr:glycerol-3-phosphate 1-O-acyltransferase PlsY [Oscillospiraceae bacterium]